MTAKLKLLLICCICFIAVQGCTYRAWYSGLQERERQECYRYSDSSAIQECLDEVNRRTYDQYEEERKEEISESSD